MSNCCCNDDFCCILKRYIGQTVTLYTTSGGQSGYGYTGVVIAVNECFVRLLTNFGAAPTCALGSDCGGPERGCGNDNNGMGNGYGNGNGNGNGRGYGSGCGYYNPLGSVTEIPLDRIASFVHNAI